MGALRNVVGDPDEASLRALPAAHCPAPAWGRCFGRWGTRGAGRRILLANDLDEVDAKARALVIDLVTQVGEQLLVIRARDDLSFREVAALALMLGRAIGCAECASLRNPELAGAMAEVISPVLDDINEAIARLHRPADLA